MSDPITTAFVQQYTSNVAFLLQQMGSRFRGLVMEGAHVGKAAVVVEQFGSTAAQKKISRHSDTPLIQVPQDRRWVYPTDYEWADLIDDQDKLRLLIDPTSPLAQAGAMALGRSIDDEIVGAFFGTAYTGESGGTAVTFPSAQDVAATVGGTSGNVGLNVDKLRSARRLLRKAEVDLDNEQAHCMIDAEKENDLLNQAQIINADYNARPVLTDGKLASYLGFDFHHSERIPGGDTSLASPSITSGHDIPVWVSSGMHLGMWNDINGRIDPRADKSYSTQVYAKGTFGATRVEEKRVVRIKCA